MGSNFGLEQKTRPLNVHDLRQEGGGWLLADYGDVILHLLTEETRRRYDLEGLWSDAHVVMKIL